MVNDLKGVEVMIHSRIIDLRRLNLEALNSKDQGLAYIYDRVTLRLTKEYQGDRRLKMSNVFPFKDVSFRQPKTKFPVEISRVVSPESNDEDGDFFVYEFNLKNVPVGDPVNLELEFIARFPTIGEGTAPIVMAIEPELVNSWILFPEDRPYRSYKLVRYPKDGSDSPRVMDSRYIIDHPYGSLIGWSVVNPDPNMIYECRWTK